MEEITSRPAKKRKIISFNTLLSSVLFVLLGLAIVFLYKSNSELKNELDTVKATLTLNSSNTTPTLTVLPPQTSDHRLGSDKAPLTLIEYADYECPFCKQFDLTLHQLLTDQGNTVSWVYRQFPLPMHQNAEQESEAAECVARIGGNTAFWNFSDKIFERTTSNGTGFALDQLQPLAEEVGVNGSAFQLCLAGKVSASKVQADIKSGDQAGVNGTPTAFLVKKDGSYKTITGAEPLTQLETEIQAFLQ